MDPRLRPALAALCALAVALAGCTQAPAPPPAEPQEEEPTEAGLMPTGEVANLSQPEEQSEFARTLDEKFHTHNYWGGALEKVLMDEDVQAAPLLPDVLNNGPFSVFEYLFLTAIAQGPGLTPFQLPEGSIVPPEAERIEVTLTWASDPKITGLYLAYSTAGDEADDITSLEPLPEGGGTYVIPTNLTTNDIPHTIKSRWRFYLVPDNSNTLPGTPVSEFLPALFNGTVHVTIKAYRNDTLYVAPPHPDFWGDNTTAELFAHNGTIAGTKALFPLPLGFVTGADDDSIEFFQPPENVTIPPHTGLLTITLAWVNNSTLPDAFNTHLELLYESPADFGFSMPDEATVEEDRIVYTIPVDATMWDSPYANESQWAFLVAVDSDAPTDTGFFGDVAFFDGTFTVTVVAEREQV